MLEKGITKKHKDTKVFLCLSVFFTLCPFVDHSYLVKPLEQLRVKVCTRTWMNIINFDLGPRLNLANALQ